MIDGVSVSPVTWRPERLAGRPGLMVPMAALYRITLSREERDSNVKKSFREISCSNVEFVSFSFLIL